MELKEAGSADLPKLPPAVAGGSLGPVSTSADSSAVVIDPTPSAEPAPTTAAPAAPISGSALAPSSATAEISASPHPPAGTVPEASNTIEPDLHAVHKDLPDLPPPAAANVPAPDVVKPASVFPVRDDIHPTPTETTGSTTSPATSDALHTVQEAAAQAVVTATELVDAAEAKLAATDPAELLDSATHAVEDAQHRLEGAVRSALAPDPNDLDPALRPFRQHDPQQLPPQPQVAPHPSNARDVPVADKPAVAATETSALKATDGDAHILPVGQDVHPTEQAAAVDKAPAGLVHAQVKKLQGAERELKGEPEQGHLVPGMEDDKLFAMMRRFNQQITHTLSPPTKLPPGEPDLRPTSLPTVPFNSEILKSNLERVYATAGVWGIYSAREMMRLMSWSEQDRHRTGTFCFFYFVAWWYSLVLPLIFGLFIVLVLYTPSRKFLFPPIPPPPGQPPSATDPTNQKGDESMIAGVGHPVEHRSKAEQIEQQAWEFTNVVQRFGVRVIVGGHGKGKQGNGEVGAKEGQPSSDSEDDGDDDGLDDETHLVVAGAGVEDEKVRQERASKKDRKAKAKAQKAEAKAKRDAMVGNIAKGAQDGLGEFADALERFANALAPPRPYPKNRAREKLAGMILAPIMLAFAIVPAHVWSQAASFGFGVAFFGQPLLIRGAKKFVQLVPDWQDKLDMRNSIFSQVPTNAQLVLHCLRVKEAQFDPLPLPPPPPTPGHVKEEVNATGLGADAADELDNPDHSNVESHEEGEEHAAEDENEVDTSGVASKVVKPVKKGILSGLRATAKKAATFKADVTIQGTKAKVGNKVDRVLYQSRAKDEGTPESYPAKMNGTSGHLIIDHRPDLVEPTLSFIPLRSPTEKRTFHENINDLVEIKKSGVFIGRAVLGWASGVQLEGAGLETRFKPAHLRRVDGLGKGEGSEKHDETFEGTVHTFSHVGRRDQLFARLISIGTQKFESV